MKPPAPACNGVNVAKEHAIKMEATMKPMAKKPMQQTLAEPMRTAIVYPPQG